MKMHTGTDAGARLVHTIQATAANVHDSNVLGELRHGAEETAIPLNHSKALQALAVIIGLKSVSRNVISIPYRPIHRGQDA